MKLSLRKPALFPLLLVIPITVFVISQVYANVRIHLAEQRWQQDLDNAKLLGEKEETVLAYLNRNELTYSQMALYNVSMLPPVSKNALGEKGIAETPTVATTFLYNFFPVDVNWHIDLAFVFDKQGRLLWYHAARYPVI